MRETIGNRKGENLSYPKKSCVEGQILVCELSVKCRQMYEWRVKYQNFSRKSGGMWERSYEIAPRQKQYRIMPSNIYLVLGFGPTRLPRLPSAATRRPVPPNAGLFIPDFGPFVRWPLRRRRRRKPSRIGTMACGPDYVDN